MKQMGGMGGGDMPDFGDDNDVDDDDDDEVDDLPGKFMNEVSGFPFLFSLTTVSTPLELEENE